MTVDARRGTEAGAPDPPPAPSWPELPWQTWEPSLATLHMWTQIVGKVRLALAPPVGHWWHIPLLVGTRGLTTSAIPWHGSAFQIDFDFVDHRLTVTDDRPGRFEMALAGKSVAAFYAELMAGLRERGIDVRIRPRPVEVVAAIPFDEDERHATYDPAHVECFWRGLVCAHRALTAFRSGFVGKASPVHFFWGGFDLAATRFSGRRAPTHPGGVPNCPDWVMEEAYSAELWSAGWWPVGGPDGPAFYAYAYPEPDAYRSARVRPSAAAYNARYGEFLLPWEAVRTAADPDRAVHEFLESTYVAAADLGRWDRPALESTPPPSRPARRPWSVRP